MSNEEAEQFMEWVKARAPQPKREWVGLTENCWSLQQRRRGLNLASDAKNLTPFGEARPAMAFGTRSPTTAMLLGWR